MDCDEDVYVDILDENPGFSEAGDSRYGGKEIVDFGEFDRWNGGMEGSDAADGAYGKYSSWSDYEYTYYGCSGSQRSKPKSLIVSSPYERGSEHSELMFGDKEHSSFELPSIVSGCGDEHASEKQECRDKETSRSFKLLRMIGDYDHKHDPEYSKHERGEKERGRNYRRRQEVQTDDDVDDDDDLERFSKKYSKHELRKKDHHRSSMRKIVINDNELDDDSELFTESAKYRDKSHFHESPDEKKSSIPYTRFGPEEKLENDHKGKEQLRSRRGEERHKLTRNHDQDGEKPMAREMMERSYEKSKEKGSEDEDKESKMPQKRKSHSTKYQSEHDDYWERERSQERKLMKRESELWERVRHSSGERELTEREKEGEFRVRDKRNFRTSGDRELIETEKEKYLRERDEAYWEESQTAEKDMASKKLNGIRDLMGRNSRILNRETKGDDYIGVPMEGEKGTRKPDRQIMDSKKLFETRKEREARLQNAYIIEKSRRTKGYKESWEKDGKIHFSEVEERRHGRVKRGKSWGREEMHSANKLYSRGQDRIFREESYEKDWERDIKGRSWKMDFAGTDSREQYPKERYHAGKGIESSGQDRKIMEDSPEKEWDKGNKEGSRRGHLLERDSRIEETENQGIRTVKGQHVRERDRESEEERQENEWDREKGERFRKRDFRHTDVRILNREVREKIWEHQVRELNNEKTVTSRRRHVVERDTWKDDIQLRDKSREREVLHSDKERHIRMQDLQSLEKNQEVEVLDRGKGVRRDHDKMDQEKIQDDEFLDRENDKNSNIRDSRSNEMSLERKHVEKRKARELWEEKDECREESKDKRDEETEANSGTETESRQKTVLAYQISFKADDRDVYNFFAKVGKVRDVRLVMDTYSRHFTGVGYVEFYHATSVTVATSLSGQLLHGLPIIVKALKADTSLVQSTTNAGGGDNIIGAFSGGSKRLFVGNLCHNVTDDMLRKVFEIFGTLERVQLPSTEAAECERGGFIEFASLDDAIVAQSLNGHLSLAGQLIKVSAVTDQDEIQGTGADLNDFKEDGNDLVPAIQDQDGVDGHSDVHEGADLSSTGLSGLSLQKLDLVGNETNNGIIISTSALYPDSVPLQSESIITKNPHSIKAYAASLKAVLQVSGAAIPIVDTIGVPSECLLLKNVFDSNLQNGEDCELRVKDDVEFKCYKFGKLKEVHVDKNAAGSVYVRFEDMQTAIIAQRSLHGRWFDGNMITATYMASKDYSAKFPTNQQNSSQGPAKWPLQNCQAGFPNSEQALTPRPSEAAWLPQNYGTRFYSQQALAQGPSPAAWLPNANPVASGVAFNNGAQFMQPIIPQGTFYGHE